MRHNRLYRHFARFRKLVFVKTQTVFFLNGLDVAGVDFGGFAGVGNDFAVFDFNNAIGLCGDFGVVRNHDNGVSFGVKLVNNLHHGFAAA